VAKSRSVSYTGFYLPNCWRWPQRQNCTNN